MKKLISYSLYGENEFYLSGAIRNAKEKDDYYPDWICRYYVAQDVPRKTINLLRLLGSEVIPMTKKYYVDGTFWRFLPMSEDDVEVTLVRDTDSVFTVREVVAVNDWLKSDKCFHIMRDHPYHRAVIPAGLFGCRRGIVNNIKDMIEKWGYYNKRGADQEFLKYNIYPIIKNNVMIHTDLVKYEGEDVEPFLCNRIIGEFVGCHKRVNELSNSEMSHYSNIFSKAKLKTYPMPYSFWQRKRAKLLLELVHWHRKIKDKLSQ